MPPLFRAQFAAVVVILVGGSIGCGVPPFDPTGKTCTAEIACPDGFHCALQRTASEGTCQAGATAPVVPPTAEDTGVPAGITLTSSGSLSIDGAGTVIEDADITGCVTINAADVVLRRSRIRCSGVYAVRVFSGHTGVVIEDVEVDGLGSLDTKGVVGGPVTLRRVRLHSLSQAIVPGSGSHYERLYVHDLTTSSPAIQSNQSSNVTFIGSAFHGPADGPALFLKASQGAVNDVRIEGNWFLEGARGMTLDGSTFGLGGITVAGNRFAREVAPASTSGDVELQWTENVWLDTGDTVPAP